MRGTGRTLFSGSRFVRWTVVPCTILAGLVIALCEEHWTFERIWKIGCLEVGFVLLALAVGWPLRFRWAGRVLGAVVFTACVLFLVQDLRKVPEGVSWTDTNAWGAAKATIVFGLPSLWYAVRGRFGFGENEAGRPNVHSVERLPILPEKDAPDEPR